MKSKLKIIIPIGIALIAIALAFVFIRFTPSETVDISGVINTAQQYLIDQKFEQAIAEFEKAIQIDPMNADAYIGIAQAYEAIGDTDKAIEWLQKGYDLTGDTSLKEEIDRLSVRSAEAETTTTTKVTTTTTQATTTTPETTTTAAPETTTATTTTTQATTTTSEVPNEDEAEIEMIRKQAIEIVKKFQIEKQTGAANSITYSYIKSTEVASFGWERIYAIKCVYDKNGNLSESRMVEAYRPRDANESNGKFKFHELAIHNINGNYSEYYHYDSKAKLHIGGQLIYGPTAIQEALYGVEKAKFQKRDNSCYIGTYFHMPIEIYTNGDNVISIQYGEWKDNTTSSSYVKLVYEEGKWVAYLESMYGEKCYIAEEGIPDGFTESVFEIPETDITFDSQEEYRDYGYHGFSYP